jgi:5-methylcytosine-specific restriction endonuclease McrA
MLTILWHDIESAGYTDQIQLGWLSHDGVRRGVLHFVSGPRSGQYKAKCDVSVQGSTVDFDYKPYEDFNAAQDMFIGVMRVQFTNPDRERVAQVLWKEKGQRRFTPCSTTATLAADDSQDFDARVAQSSKLTSTERRKRLATALKKPIRMQVVSTMFLRNPDVVAEVLSRAAGVCEACKKPAPFKRADSGVPYLEVHHKKRLADGGNDTVENAIAACPDCHREAHYG